MDNYFGVLDRSYNSRYWSSQINQVDDLEFQIFAEIGICDYWEDKFVAHFNVKKIDWKTPYVKELNRCVN